MAARKLKISDNDVQLYLLGELEGDKAEYISRINALSNSDLKSKMDKDIKSTITKITNVDNMLQMAADTSYSMPEDLENRINSALASKATVQKKTSLSLADKIKNYFSASNMWSLAGGGAAASLGMLAIIQIQPGLLIDINATNAGETVFRGVVANTAQMIGCEATDKGKWFVSDNFLAQVSVCNANQFDAVLKDGDSVEIGKSFRVFVLPTKVLDLTINYVQQDGKRIQLAEFSGLASGQMVKIPEGLEEPFGFAEPKGTDSIEFSVNGVLAYKLRFTVK